MKRLLFLLYLISSAVFAQDLKQSAQTHFNNQDWEAAAKDYKKYLKKNENDSSAWYSLGGSYLRLDQYEKAIESFEKAKETNFSIFFVSYSMGKTYALMKNEVKMLIALNEGQTKDYQLIHV